MKRGKQAITAALAVCMVAACTGCRRNDINRREMDTIDFVRMVAIDAAEKNGQIAVTLESGEESKKEQEEQNGIKCMTAEADSFSAAFAQMQAEHGALLHLAHSDCFLIGEDAAKNGLASYFDFVSRNNQIQLTADVFVVQGMRAEEWMRRCGETEDELSRTLKNLADQIRERSVVTRTKVIDVMNMLDDPYNAMKIPYLTLRENGETAEMQIGGYAVFGGDVLCGFADEDASRGMTLLNGEVYSGLIPMRNEDGKTVVTRIGDIKTKLKLKAEQNGLRVNVNTELHSVLEETRSIHNLFLPEQYEAAVERQNRYVTYLIQRAVETAREMQVDALSLAEVFSMQHPILWEERKQDWQTWIRQAQFEIRVSSEIDRSYDYEATNRVERTRGGEG